MTNKEFFDNKNIELFMPDGIEYIHDILGNIGFKNYKSIEARDKGLEVLQKLFELDLIDVFNWGKFHEEFKNKELSKEERMEQIKKIWFVGADFSDFVGMPMFKYKNWYLKNLEKEGLKLTTNWEWFVKNKIGDLEQWIEEHRPTRG